VSDAPDTQTHDQELLDQIFERAVQQLEEGLPMVIGDLLGHREDLLGQVERLVRLAQQVVAGHPRTLPAVRGYTILGELGQGGMGTVYLARQERLGRPVALKVLSPSTALAHSARERFRTEALAIARLQHPNIVAVHDVVHEADVYAYAMEWVDGKSLAELISHLERCGDAPGIGDVRTFLDAPAGALEHATVATFICRVGIAIGRALGAVHRAGLLHRDVKPANVLLRRDGTPLLSDFGLARELDTATLTQAGHFVGTPAYAAPEQLRGSSADLDARTDVYGLGVTLYHALTLRLPFSGGSTAEILRRIEAGQAVPLRQANPHLSADLQTIVAKAMDPEPDRRYPTGDELADDLERLLSLQPIRARPAGLMTRTVKLARRNRGAVLGATLGGLLALILAVLIGGYAFVVPGWAAKHLSDARLALLEPGRNDAIFATVYWQRPPGKGVGTSDDFLHAPLASYQKVLRLEPTNAAVRLERDIVELARELNLHPDRLPALPARLRAHARLACTYAERWAEASDPPHLERQLLENASASELRSLGLLGYLCDDIDTTLQAWSQMDLVTDPDPLVEASLGQLYLLLDQPARAYPRLRNAFRAFPEAGFLCVSLADAAVQCGDVIKAEQLLDRARRLGGLDTTLGLLRVQADLYAATGRDDLAIAIWTSENNGQAVAQCHYGQYLEAHGDFEGATRAYGYAGGAGRYRRAWDGFRRVAPRWWGGLTDEERWWALRESFDQPVASGWNSLVHTLWAYAEYVLLPLRGAGEAIAAQPGSLEAVACGLRAPGRKGTLVRACHYPAWLKNLHATALLSPWPVHGSLALAALDAAGRQLNLPGWPSDESPEPASASPPSGS
jgi:tRNA A-37 threonylcarbamoyl transferase component Bud32/tetratricopeptide (TPR) repeat protein